MVNGKILFLCNTYFQLIEAIHLKLVEYFNYDVDIVLTDQSKDMGVIADCLTNLGLFENVAHILVREYENILFNTFLLRYRYVKDGIIGNDYGASFLRTPYDIFIYYNYDLVCISIFSQIYNYSNNIECHRFEEGIGSYIVTDYMTNKKLNTIRLIRSTLKKKNISQITNTFYCFQPELYPGTLQPIRIPPITSNSETVEVLRKIFFEPGVDYAISQKYIFFGCPYDSEGEVPIGEHDLVRQIAELVGYENLIVKAHPRDFSDDYTAMGISLYPHSAIPWEALQLTMDFSDKVFLTSVSSSVMSLNMTLENPIKTYYLFNMTRARENSSARITIDMLDKFKEKFDFNPEDYNIHIVDRIEEILE